MAVGRVLSGRSTWWCMMGAKMENEYVCGKCGVVSRNEGDYELHKEECIVIKNSVSGGSGAGESMVRCANCRTLFRSNSDYQNHACNQRYNLDFAESVSCKHVTLFRVEHP